MALGREETELSAARLQLIGARSSAYVQGVSITQLNACLAGVEQALNQLAVRDQTGAVASLDSVSSSCRGVQARL